MRCADAFLIFISIKLFLHGPCILIISIFAKYFVKVY